MLHMLNLLWLLLLQVWRHCPKTTYMLLYKGHIIQFLLALNDLVSYVPAIVSPLLCSICKPSSHPNPHPRGNGAIPSTRCLDNRIQPKPTKDGRRGIADSKPMLEGKGEAQDLDIVKSGGVFHQHDIWGCHSWPPAWRKLVDRLLERGVTHFEMKTV